MGAFCSLAQVTGVHRQSRDENDEIPVADALPCPDSLLDSLANGILVASASDSEVYPRKDIADHRVQPAASRSRCTVTSWS